jgi:hypothetical protein
MRRIVLASCAIVVLAVLFAAAPASAARWELLTMVQPEGATDAGLEDVSCIEIAVCTAVGSSITGGTRRSMVERREGGAWRLQTLPAVREAVDDVLHGVSCTTTCVAVGEYSTVSATFALAEVWSGGVWSLTTPARPVGSTGGVIWSVSCSEASACTAVGTSYNGGTGSAMAQRWNGRAWSLQTVPVPAGAVGSELQGVSCGSATGCIAVGQYTERSGAGVALAMTWNGTSWTVRTIVPPREAAASRLLDVSCVGPSACTAVGSWDTEGPEEARRTLAQRWNGSEMRLQTTRDRAEWENNELRNVSCLTERQCKAVGASETATGEFSSVTLAEHWNGTEWATETTLNPGSKLNELEGVSCRGAEICIAVGAKTSENEAGFFTEPLGERFG